MEKIQIEKTIATFKELTDSQKEDVLNKNRFINVEYTDWNDYILAQFIEDIKTKLNLDIDTIDITWAVGDRNAHFGVLSKKVISQLLDKHANNGVYDIDTTDKLGSFLSHRGGGICSQESTERGLAHVYFEDDAESERNKNKEVSDQINDVLNQIIDLCVEYHNKNEEAYNYALSDESVKDTLEVNEYKFDVETLEVF
jgi:hypothetical protein